MSELRTAAAAGPAAAAPPTPQSVAAAMEGAAGAGDTVGACEAALRVRCAALCDKQQAAVCSLACLNICVCSASCWWAAGLQLA